MCSGRLRVRDHPRARATSPSRRLSQSPMASTSYSVASLSRIRSSKTSPSLTAICATGPCGSSGSAIRDCCERQGVEEGTEARFGAVKAIGFPGPRRGDAFIPDPDAAHQRHQPIRAQRRNASSTAALPASDTVSGLVCPTITRIDVACPIASSKAARSAGATRADAVLLSFR
jgi:hypothetical protein